MIILQPVGGLCNRMRSIDSAIELSEKIEQPLRIIWVSNSDINCKFSEIFSVPPEINILTEIKINSRLIGAPLEQLSRIYYSNFQNLYFNIMSTPQGNEIHPEILSTTPQIFIRSDQPFYPAKAPFTYFFPKKPLQQCIDSYRNENRIGVHIRRADNINSIKHSPLLKFIEYMSEEIDSSAGVTFFLSTDDPEVETKLRKTFKEKIFTHPKRSLNRNNPQAIQDAVIDLYSLANCRKLIGSYWSSFTDTAWQLRQINKIIIGPEQPVQVDR